MSRRGEDCSTNTVEDAAQWEAERGWENYIDNRPTRAELDQEERDAERRSA